MRQCYVPTHLLIDAAMPVVCGASRAELQAAAAAREGAELQASQQAVTAAAAAAAQARAHSEGTAAQAAAACA